MKKSILIPIIIFISFSSFAQPLNDIVDRKIVAEKKVLKYPNLRENDIMWEKRVWRVLDVREKMNLPFAYPKAPLFQIITEASADGEIPLYSVETDDFAEVLTMNEIDNLLSETDTVEVFNPETYEPELKVVRNEINVEDVKRYRIKEVWYFDSHSATLKVRILGIAPMIDVFDENGNFRYEKPLFWVHYPSSRKTFARYTVFNSQNDNSRQTWEDLFEMRQFSSYVYKESNVHDTRLQEHLTGVDLLLQSRKIEQGIFNYEHDLWSF